MTSAQPQEQSITPYRNLGVLSASHSSFNAIQADVLHSSLQTPCAYVHSRLTFPARFRHPRVPAMPSVKFLIATTKKACSILSQFPFILNQQILMKVQPLSSTRLYAPHASDAFAVSSQYLTRRSASGSSVRCRCALLFIDISQSSRDCIAFQVVFGDPVAGSLRSTVTSKWLRIEM